MTFEISVVIPVYNAAKYVRTAVESALAQEDVAEILLVEDASPDDSLDVCESLAREYDTVRLLRHPGNINKGAGASRNLGMLAARYDFIAFLDADDYFLPNRFQKTKDVFKTHTDADGVYEAIGHFKEGHLDSVKVYTINKSLNPNDLFNYLIRGTYGHFHTNGLTIKKSLLSKAGNFNTSLRLHQDSELWLRFAFHGSLYPGNIEHPVTLVRRHEENRIAHANDASRLQLWDTALEYFGKQSIRTTHYVLLLKKNVLLRSKIQGTNQVLEFIRLWLRRNKLDKQ